MNDLQGKVALITGGSSGIGAALGKRLGRRGVRVALAARRTEMVEQVAAEIRAAGGEALALTCDVREPDQVQSLIATTVERFGGLDILIPNAGFGYRSPIVDGEIARWKAMFDTNILGVMVTLKYGIPHLLARGQGDIFLLSSVAGHVVAGGGSAYSASKFAVEAIGEALRQEVTRQNIRVTVLAPGVVVSGFQEAALYPQGLIDSWLEGTPPIVPDEIAQIVETALDLPHHISLNEILIRPTGQLRP